MQILSLHHKAISYAHRQLMLFAVPKEKWTFPQLPLRYRLLAINMKDIMRTGRPTSQLKI